MADSIVLSDGVVVLDRHTDADIAANVAGEDDEIARRLGWWPERSTEQTTRAAFAAWADDWSRGTGRWAFAVREAGSRRLVGGCELRRQDDGRTGHVSYWTNAGHRGQGHAARALTLLCGYAASVGIERLESHVAADNTASLRVSERAGFAAAETYVDERGESMVRLVRRTAPQQ